MESGKRIWTDGEFSWRAGEPGPGDIVHELPMPRSPVASALGGVFLVAFAIPLFTVTGFMDGELDDLFSVVISLFTGFWLLGWSVGVALIAMVFLGSLFGRERLILKPGVLQVVLTLFGIGFTRTFDGAEIEDLVRVEPTGKSGVAWRGPHLQFRYRDSTVAFGSRLDPLATRRLTDEIIDHVLIPASRRPKSRTLKTPGSAPMPVDPGPGGESGPTAGSASSTALLIANLIPVFGVLLLDWRVGDVLLLYWSESAIIGVLNVAKIWRIAGWPGVFPGVFFLGHYGGFMAGHLLFIYAFMFEGEDGGSMALIDVLGDFVALLPAFLALLVSHVVSYFQNFLGRREYLGKTVSQQMKEPYRRIILMHVTIIFGGFLVMLMENALPALLLMIALKTGTDLRAHLKEHRETGRTNVNEEVKGMNET